jgi:hypothetical protein
VSRDLARSRRGSRLYYGWLVLLVAAAAMVGTLPGRTQGLGLITAPLIAELDIDRSFYFIILINATVVFAAPSHRIAGVILMALLLWIWRPVHALSSAATSG